MSINDTENRGNLGGNNVGGNAGGGRPFGRPNLDEARIREQLSSTGNELFDKGKQLMSWGNARRVVVTRDGHTLVQFPLTVGAVATLLAPQLVAIGIVAAILTGSSIEVHHEGLTG